MLDRTILIAPRESEQVRKIQQLFLQQNGEPILFIVEKFLRDHFPNALKQSHGGMQKDPIAATIAEKFSETFLSTLPFPPLAVLDIRWKLFSSPDPFLFAISNRYPGIPFFSSALCFTQELRSMLQSQNVLRFNGLPTFFPENALIEVTPADAPEKIRKAAEELFRMLDRNIQFVNEEVCFITPRIIAMIINEAFFCLQESVASPEDIDTAMLLGTNYPRGPIEWGSKMGYALVLDILDTLYNTYHQERYRCAVLLRQKALEETTSVHNS